MNRVSKIPFYLFVFFFIGIPLVFYYEQKIVSPYLILFHFFEPAKEALARLLTLLLAAYLCIQIIFFKKPLIKTSLYIPLLLILLLQGLSLLWAQNTIQGLEYWIHWICLFAFFFVCLHMTTASSLTTVMNIALGCAAIICISSLICYIFQADLPFLRKREIFWWASTFGNYKFAGEYITPLIFWAIGLYFLNPKHKYVYLLFLVIFLFSSISLYRSRSSLIALFILFGVFSILYIKNLKLFLCCAMAGIIFFASLAFFIPSLRIPLKHPSNSQRITIWKNTFNIGKDHWLKGVGIGNFNLFFPYYKSPADRQMIPDNNFIRYAHNEYLQIWAELGILGLLLFAIAFYIFSKKIFTYLKTSLPLTPSHPGEGEGGGTIPFEQKMFVISLYLSFLCSALIAFFTFNFQNSASSYFAMATMAFTLKAIPSSPAFAQDRRLLLSGSFAIFILGTFIYFGATSLHSLFSVYAYLKGGAYMKSHNYKTSVSFLKKSLTYKSDWETHHLLSRAYASDHAYENAIHHLHSSLKLNPSYEVSWYELGLYYEKNNNLDKAAESYQKLLTLSPDFKKAFNRLGNISLKKNRVKEARQYFEKVFQFPAYHQGEEHGLALLGLAICDVREKEFQSALTHLTDVYRVESSYLKRHVPLYQFWLEKN